MIRQYIGYVKYIPFYWYIITKLSRIIGRVFEVKKHFFTLRALYGERTVRNGFVAPNLAD